MSHDAAKRHAEAEYEHYKAAQKEVRHRQADAVIRALSEAEKALPRPPRRR